MKLKEIRSFKCAIIGILHCIKNERHMRIHTCIAIYVLLFSSFFDLSIEKYCILLLTISSVFAAEMVNTVAEELTDLSAEDYNPMAKVAKDIAAGAVLICAVFAIFIGVLLFWNINKYIEIYYFFIKRPLYLILLFVSVIISFAYIYIGPMEIISSIKRIRFKRKKR